ncbi:hypothetical protein PS664_04281 [Pseudomonas fluorescens]|nr:hypothetical protein PS664_04281 [Pseudomonas fluorescens]
MSYFDDELITEQSSQNINLDILPTYDHGSIVRKTNENIALQEAIAWNKLHKSIKFADNRPNLATSRPLRKIIKVADDKIIIVGDAVCDEAYCVKLQQLEEAPRVLPQIRSRAESEAQSAHQMSRITFLFGSRTPGIPPSLIRTESGRTSTGNPVAPRRCCASVDKPKASCWACLAIEGEQLVSARCAHHRHGDRRSGKPPQHALSSQYNTRLMPHSFAHNPHVC